MEVISLLIIFIIHPSSNKMYDDGYVTRNKYSKVKYKVQTINTSRISVLVAREYFDVISSLYISTTLFNID